MGKGALCGQSRAFNLQAATRVAANDKPGRERLCPYILRPPLANDRLHILPGGAVRLDFKKPWSGQIVPQTEAEATATEKPDKPAGKSK